MCAMNVPLWAGVHVYNPEDDAGFSAPSPPLSALFLWVRFSHCKWNLTEGQHSQQFSCLPAPPSALTHWTVSSANEILSWEKRRIWLNLFFLCIFSNLWNGVFCIYISSIIYIVYRIYVYYVKRNSCTIYVYSFTYIYVHLCISCCICT